jgi:hypothetical protein
VGYIVGEEHWPVLRRKIAAKKAWDTRRRKLAANPGSDAMVAVSTAAA